MNPLREFGGRIRGWSVAEGLVAGGNERVEKQSVTYFKLMSPLRSGKMWCTNRHVTMYTDR
eukprot:4124496-Pyramimonas_sp.AAC.1